MTTYGYIAALQRRHQDLDRQIEEEFRSKVQDDLRIADLKKRKLEIKDELSRLEATTH